MKDTSAVIVCAGNSTRMNGVNKQFLQIKGIPVAGYSMKAFENSESIAEIIVVARESDIEDMKTIAEKLSISKLSAVVAGGSTRQQSVLNGLKKVSDTTKLIAVHDGARPLVIPEFIEKTIADARIFGGAVLGVPVKDTIKVVNDNLIIDTPYRPSLYITQTPQVFKKSVYYEGMDFAMEHGLDFTDDCQLAEAVGIKVYMTNGDYKNIKITTPEDIRIAETIMED
jgi:2-C-methyl-D-erythritol 4-phosphate cytidylyltransferase